MKTTLKIALLSMLFATTANAAHSGFELGVGAGYTHATAGSSFKDTANDGNSNLYWLGYSLTPNMGVELGYDALDFDGINTKHKVISLTGVYRLNEDNWVHPILKLGLGAVESKNLANDKKNSFAAKAAAGIEADFCYVSAGVLANYMYINKAGDADMFKNSQALVPALYLTIHGNHTHKQSTSKVEENTVISTVKEVVDSDKDGISDEDDKCPNTPANAVVNAYGCAETQKASIKLNVVFASGKTDLTAGQKTEIDNLANFMKKYPETSVEIAGHTDNTGSAKVNNALSQKRAESVAAALVEAGIDKSRVTAKGYGSSQPVADNKTDDGRAQNRRVMAEISVTVVKTKK